MSANIFGDRFYGTRKPAWHGLGKVFETAITPGEAVAAIGMDYTVEKFPMGVFVDDAYVETDKFAIMRSPTADDNEWKMFGVVSANYEIIQNADLAVIMESLAEVWPLETMGAIDNGKTVFMAFNTGGVDVAGDPVNGYFTLVNIQDGGTSVKLIYTPVRVVCQNTLVTGLSRATVNLEVQHTNGASAMIAARTNLIAKAQTAIDETTQVFRNLAAKKLSLSEVATIFETVYPEPKIPDDMALINYSQEDLGDLLFSTVQRSNQSYEYYVERAHAYRDGASTLYGKLNDEYPALANTAWHAYNAVVELADYRGKNNDAADRSSLFGGRAKEKEKAFSAVSRVTR